MIVVRTNDVPIRVSEDVMRVRQAVRASAVEVGLGLVDQTKIITAASELARNTLDYGGGGTARIEVLNNDPKRGVRVTFDDRGPGIDNIDLALTDGYTAGNGLGLGLGGARRLSDQFEIHSEPGVGTRVSIARWK